MENWRRGGDSNSRDPFRSTRFPSARTRPLCDLSIEQKRRAVYVAAFVHASAVLRRLAGLKALAQRAKEARRDLHRHVTLRHGVEHALLLNICLIHALRGAHGVTAAIADAVSFACFDTSVSHFGCRE